MSARWIRVRPDGSKYTFKLRERSAPRHSTIDISYYHPSYGFVADWTACAECGCVEQAGDHHRDGCSQAAQHRADCRQCAERPPTVPAYQPAVAEDP